VQEESKQGNPAALNEAVEALKSLGYAEREIQRVIGKISGQDLSADQYVKKALQAIIRQ
jgi:Holliday junction DNA helicase RuvA